MFVEVPYITLTKHKAEIRPTNTMPQEHTRYSISTTDLRVDRPDSGTSWGAVFVGEITSAYLLFSNYILEFRLFSVVQNLEF